MAPPLCPQAKKYLEHLARHPELNRQQCEEAIGSGKRSASRWACVYGAAFRAEEEAIRQRYKVAKLHQKRAAEQAGIELPEAGDGDLVDPRLLRFLELYEEKKHRTEAIRACQAEGIELRWADIVDALRWSKTFARRFGQVWDEGLVEVEDEIVKKGRKGVTHAALAVLRAHQPDRYGNKLKVSVEGSVQLTAVDRTKVEAAKQSAIRQFRKNAARTAAQIAGGEEVVGEVLAEVVRAS